MPSVSLKWVRGWLASGALCFRRYTRLESATEADRLSLWLDAVAYRWHTENLVEQRALFSGSPSEPICVV
jgi:hypothetical protein